MDETILQKLRDEHSEIKVILNKLERARAGLKQEVFDELKAVLLPHMEGEEETLYLHLRIDAASEKAASLANEADFAHQELKDLIHMMDGSEVGSEEWDSLFQEFKECLLSHVEEEETKLFNEVKDDFSREELILFRTEYEEAKYHASSH